MKRFFLVCIGLLLVLSGLVVGCAPQGEEASQLKEFIPCEIKLESVHNVFAGQESITQAVVINVLNPNDYMVTLSELGYALYCDGTRSAMVQLTDDMYIPANKNITVIGTSTIPFATWMGKELMEGRVLTAQETVSALWDKVSTGKCPYQVEGWIIVTSDELGVERIEFTLES